MSDRQMIERLLAQLTRCAMDLMDAACTCAPDADEHNKQCTGLLKCNGYMENVAQGKRHLEKGKNVRSQG